MIARSRIGRSPLVGIVPLLGLLLGAVQAEARPEVVRWTHSAPADVAFFEAHVGSSPGSHDQVISLGKPQPDSEGIYQATIEVPDAADVYIALRAVGADESASPLSNERFRPAPVDAGGDGGDGGDGGVSTPGAGEPMPPTTSSGTHYDFDGLAIDSAVPGWLDTAEGHSLLEDDSLFGIASLGGNEVLSTVSERSDIHSHVSGNGSTWTAPLLRGRMAIEDPTASVGVTVQSQYPASDAYYRLGRSAGGAFRIEGRPTLDCASPSTGIVPEAGVWYRFQLEVLDEGSQSRIRAFVWREGQSEPGAAQAECVDARSSRPAGGTIGVWSAGAGGKYWDDLEVIEPVDLGGSGPLEPPILIQVAPAP